MTLRLDKQTVSGGSYTEVDLPASAIVATKLQVSYNHPAVLKLEAYARQSTYPLGIRNFVRFWVDDFPSSNGAIQTSSNPCFEGFIWDVQPTASNLVSMTCFAPDHMASREIPVMSTTWLDEYTPGVGAVPRIVFNCFNWNDDDFAFVRMGTTTSPNPLLAWTQGATVGNMFATLFDDATFPLDYWNAKMVGDTAYVPGELNLFTQVPLDKEVLESMQFGEAIRQLRTYIRDYKFIWNPGIRKWRFIDPSNSPTVTLTLNLKDGNANAAAPNEVLMMDIRRSLDGRAPAVKFVGPETTTLHTFYFSNGDALWYGNGTTLETYTDATGMHDEVAYQMVRITDPDLRRGAHLLPYQVLVSMPTGIYDPGNPAPFQLMFTQSPTLELTYDNGVSWETVLGCYFDFQNGIVHLPCLPFRWYSDPPMAASTQHYFAPNGFRLTWASYSAPLEVRWPTSGFTGTSYTVANMQTEKQWYSEDLAVGVNDYGIPVTTQHRRDQYSVMAQHQQQYRKDIAYTGVIVLDGLRFEFMNLDRNVAIAAVNADGNAQLTGWRARS